MGNIKIVSGAQNQPVTSLINTTSGIAEGIAVTSAPPENKCRVTNLYVDPDTGKMIVEYDDTPI